MYRNIDSGENMELSKSIDSYFELKNPFGIALVLNEKLKYVWNLFNPDFSSKSDLSRYQAASSTSLKKFNDVSEKVFLWVAVLKNSVPF